MVPQATDVSSVVLRWTLMADGLLVICDSGTFRSVTLLPFCTSLSGHSGFGSTLGQIPAWMCAGISWVEPVTRSWTRVWLSSTAEIVAVPVRGTPPPKEGRS